mgnify:CR=1 FL=1
MAAVIGARPVAGRRRRILPGFGISLGYTLAWLGLIVLIPLVGVFVKASGLGLDGLWRIWTEPRVLSALWVSFGTALAAAAFNAVMGTWVAWVFVRYRFSGKRLFDAMIDLPFALPTAVAGIARTMPAQFPSTAQDLARGKRSEIDHLNGFVLRRGEALGVPVPANRLLWTLVRLLEDKPARA